MSFSIDFFGVTDTGLVRSNNEDAFVLLPGAGVCGVADGMGGAAAGECASEIFAATAREVFGTTPVLDEQQRSEGLRRAFTLANRRILEHVHQYPAHAGMGTTAELLAFTPAGFVLGHIGDSRTYRLRPDGLKQLTRDHSLVQEQLEQGIISAEQARSHRMRNVILRAVGTHEEISLDLVRGTLQAGDLFLLCSDGLTDMVDDARIRDVLAGGADLQQIAGRLVENAKAGGGRDNITVVLARVNP